MAQKKNLDVVISVKYVGDKAQIQINNTKASLQQLNSTVKDLNTGMKDTNMATGAASATVLELGRAVSDSNYGIRGMANNLSQLASNFVYTTKQMGGFEGGIDAILKSLAGPLGLILLFQSGIALLEKWAMSSEKAAKATNELNDTFVAAGMDLQVFLDQIEKGNFTQEQLLETVDDLNLKYKDLNVSIGENGELTDESRKAIDEKIISLEKLAKSSAVFKILEDDLVEIRKEELELYRERKRITEEFAADFIFDPLTMGLVEGKEGYIETIEAMIERDEEALKSHKGTIETFYGEVDAYLENFTEGDKEFMAVLNLRRLRDRTSSLNEMKDALSDLKNVFSEEFLPIFGQTPTTTTKPDGGDGDGDGFFDFDKLYLETMETHDAFMQIDFDLRRRRLDSASEFNDEFRIMASEANNDLLRDEIEHQKMMAEVYPEGSIERHQAESELAMMRMDLLDAELEHELLIIEEKMRVQMEYVSFVEGIGDVFSRLGAKSKELATLGLIIEKGAAIASVVVSASQSISNRIAAHNQIPSFIHLLGVSTPNPVKGLDAIDMAKDIKMTKTSSAISIASILATAIKGGRKTVPSAGGRAGGGEGGGGRTFDFNLVGSTGTNQLAEAVGAQFQEPIQAYVVSSQITSQQELDLQIETGASLGD
jgi:hypothetical protein